MDERLRPVSIGLVIGLVSLVFGILWAVFLATQHERIHRTLEESKVISDAGYLSSRGVAFAGVSGHEAPPKVPMEMPMGMHGEEEAKTPPEHPVHEDPVIDIAHERLTRGHIHWMGLGTLTIAVSLLLAFLNSPLRLKTVASVFTAVGGFFYPMNWIAMGYRTPSLGPEAAERSVMLTAGPMVFLALAGVLITIYCLVRGISQKR